MTRYSLTKSIQMLIEFIFLLIFDEAKREKVAYMYKRLRVKKGREVTHDVTDIAMTPIINPPLIRP